MHKLRLIFLYLANAVYKICSAYAIALVRFLGIMVGKRRYNRRKMQDVIGILYKRAAFCFVRQIAEYNFHALSVLTPAIPCIFALSAFV